ncbi:hypothetical protein AMTR_s00002p00242460 [Amborella trichopoda]|uniref:Uncharacterized protein n=1 Tax=Amborella trichopoda TaxID=13333 RepID=W1P124_AMBTC|nr:hypothetical protein AMTR_s00002p00242460 [Amborella trichopoda]
MQKLLDNSNLRRSLPFLECAARQKSRLHLGLPRASKAAHDPPLFYQPVRPLLNRPHFSALFFFFFNVSGSCGQTIAQQASRFRRLKRRPLRACSAPLTAHSEEDARAVKNVILESFLNGVEIDVNDSMNLNYASEIKEEVLLRMDLKVVYPDIFQRLTGGSGGARGASANRPRGEDEPV